MAFHSSEKVHARLVPLFCCQLSMLLLFIQSVCYAAAQCPISVEYLQYTVLYNDLHHFVSGLLTYPPASAGEDSDYRVRSFLIAE